MSTPSLRPHVVLYRDKKIPLAAAGVSAVSLVGSIICLLVLLVGGFAIPTTPHDALFFGFGVLGPPLSLAGVAFFLARTNSKDPILRLDGRGIYTCHCKVGYIPWIDVASVSENPMQSGSLLVIHLRDPLKYYNKLSGTGQAAIQMDIRNLDGITIPEKVLPLTVAETIDEIGPIVDQMVEAHPTQVTVQPRTVS